MRGRGIRIASRDEVQAYQYELAEILDIIGYPDAFITDRSLPSDFFGGGEDQRMNEVLKETGDHFGIPAPTPDEFLVDIAKRGRQARKGR